MTVLDLYVAAWCIMLVLIILNLTGFVKVRSVVDLSWSWIAVVLFGAAVWMEPSKEVVAVFVLFAILNALNTWVAIRGS